MVFDFSSFSFSCFYNSLLQVQGITVLIDHIGTAHHFGFPYLITTNNIPFNDKNTLCSFDEFIYLATIASYQDFFSFS